VTGKIRRRAGEWRALWQAFRSVRKHRGTFAAARLAVAELLFDPIHGTDTSITAAEAAGGPPYESSNPILFRRLLDTMPADVRSGAFLDFGSGKGRALLIAQRYGFARVIGIEASEELCMIAKANAVRSRRGACPVEVRLGDAARFEIPDDVTVAYFYNPFETEVMQQVASNLARSLREAPRPFRIGYLHPLGAHLLVRAGFVPVRTIGRDGLILRGPA
jgi:SAM-dependent methyltransferase